jgi:hypothetical protein
MSPKSSNPKIEATVRQTNSNTSLAGDLFNLVKDTEQALLKMYRNAYHSDHTAINHFYKRMLLVLICMLAIVLPIRLTPGEPTIQIVQAQSEVVLRSLQVQLWPEYDQPSMLVIVDFELAQETGLPARVTFRFPEDANLTAVASQETTGLINAEYEGPKVENGWQIITIIVKTATTYHLEYYEPLEIEGNLRNFIYQWNGTYPVTGFSASILKPVDTTNLTTEPRLDPVTNPDGSTVYTSQPVSLTKGEQYNLSLTYNKSSDTLFIPPQDLRPSTPVDEKTEGRISLQNYLPFILGAIGLMVVIGGLVYYWQSGSKRAGGRRRRKPSQQMEKEPATSIYCPQCGTRAQMNDQFCRVCGTRLRKKET